MADYRCYVLGLSGSIQAAHDIDCANDEAAVAAARVLSHPGAFEVWQRHRRIYPIVAASGPDAGGIETSPEPSLQLD